VTELPVLKTGFLYRARLRAEILLEFSVFVFEGICVAWLFAFPSNIRPFLGIIPVQLQPLLGRAIGVGKNRLYRTFRLTHATIDAFFRMNNEHVFSGIEAIDWANLDTILIFAFNAAFGDDICHFVLFPPNEAFDPGLTPEL
jgi:hypothetical protein